MTRIKTTAAIKQHQQRNGWALLSSFSLMRWVEGKGRESASVFLSYYQPDCPADGPALYNRPAGVTNTNNRVPLTLKEQFTDTTRVPNFKRKKRSCDSTRISARYRTIFNANSDFRSIGYVHQCPFLFA